MSNIQSRHQLSLNLGNEQKTIDVAKTKTTKMGRILAKLGLIGSAEMQNSSGSTVHLNVNSLYKRVVLGKTGLDEKKPADKAQIAELVKSLKKTHRLPKDKIISAEFVQTLFNDVKIPGYVGPIDQQNLPQGRGKLRLPDGSIYEGDFIQGEMNGHGKITMSTKDGQFPEYTLEGTFRDGKVLKGTYVAYAMTGVEVAPDDSRARFRFHRTGSEVDFTYKGTFTQAESEKTNTLFGPRNLLKFSGDGKITYTRNLHLMDFKRLKEIEIVGSETGIDVKAEKIRITSEEGTFVNSKLSGEGTRVYWTDTKSHNQPNVEIQGNFENGILQAASGWKNLDPPILPSDQH